MFSARAAALRSSTARTLGVERNVGILGVRRVMVLLLADVKLAATGVDRSKGGPGDDRMIREFRVVSIRKRVDEEAICCGSAREVDAPGKNAGATAGPGCAVGGKSVVVGGRTIGAGWEGEDGDPAAEFVPNAL